MCAGESADENVQRVEVQPITQTGGWKEYQMLVLSELQTLRTDVNKLSEDFTNFKIEDARDKTKLYSRTGLVSLIGGAIPAIVVLAVLYIRTLL